MKIVVNRGRTIHRGVTTGKKAVFDRDGNEVSAAIAPEIERHKPGAIIDVPDAEAKNLIARGAATKYEPPKVEAEKVEKAEK